MELALNTLPIDGNLPVTKNSAINIGLGVVNVVTGSRMVDIGNDIIQEGKHTQNTTKVVTGTIVSIAGVGMSIYGIYKIVNS